VQRIAYVAHVKHGKEPECREVQAHMPTGGLRRLGIHGVEAFIGSGAMVWIFDCEEQDFQGLFQRFFSDPGIRGFLDKLRPFVDGLPARGEGFAPADTEHAGDEPAARPIPGAATSAHLPFAASAYRWSREESDAGPERA
jgi:hypothetical protein